MGVKHSELLESKRNRGRNGRYNLPWCAVLGSAWDKHVQCCSKISTRYDNTTTRSSAPLCYFSNSESNIIPAEKEKKKTPHTLN